MRQKLRRVIAAAAVAAAALAATIMGVAGRGDRLLFDAAMRFNRATAPAVASERLVVVGMDEAFLEGVDEPLSLSHRYLARFLDVMGDSRAAAVGLDVVLPEKRFDTLAPVAAPTTDYHRMLVAGLLQAVQRVPVVVAKAWDADRGHYRDLQLDYVAALDMQPKGFDPQGSALLCPDSDGVLRRYPGRDCQPDRSDRTFASELVAAATGRRQAASTGLIDYRLGGEFLYVPLQDVFDLQDAGNAARLQQLFAGRIVLLGAILDDTDLLALPVPLAEWRPGDRRVPGVLAHAQMVRMLLTGRPIRPLPSWTGALLVLLAVGLLALGRLRTAMVLAAVMLALLALGTVLALRAGIWLAPTTPAFAIGLMLALRLAESGAADRRHRGAMREAFAGHVDARTLEALVQGRAATPATGSVHVAVLECELRLAQAEGEGAASLARRAAAAMDAATAAVHRHGGTLDAVAGTRLSAFFGAIPPLPCPEKSALEAAADIVDALAANAAGERLAPRVAVAVHADDVVAAMVTTGGRPRYTILGDAYRETAALLRAAGPDPIACSTSVAQALGAPPWLRQASPGRHAWDPQRPLWTPDEERVDDVS